MIIELNAIAVLYGACAILYAGLATLILVGRQSGRSGLWLAGACGITAIWSGAVALSSQSSFGQSSPSGVAGWLELARFAAWYGFMLHLYRRSVTAHRQLTQAFTTMGLLALVVVGGLPLLNAFSGQPPASLWSIGTAIRLGFAVASILLVENLYFNTPAESRWHINLLCVALGGLFVYDLLLYSDAVLFRQVSNSLVQGRAAAMIVAAPLIAVAAARGRKWKIDIHVSRDVVFHSFTLIASGLFLLGLAAIGEIFRRGGAEWGQVAEITLLFGGVLSVAVLVTSGSARSRVRAMVLDNFFSHRYDYRREWMRCIETLTTPDAHVGLHRRAIMAIAQVVDSPAGALFVRAPEEVAFLWAGSWNLPAATMPIPPGHPLVPEFRDGDWTVVLDTVAGSEDWFKELPRAWMVVPLHHFGAIIGFVVVARARAQFRLDREVYALLRVVAQEVASRIAEQRASQILSQTQQLREYSQRFAFVVHDIKNVSGQLSMLLTNAEVYADNPEFQRDMLATVRASVGKITRLLSRLQAERQERSHALIAPMERLKTLVEASRMTRGGTIDLIDEGDGVGIPIDPESFDAVVTHLLNNAIEAGGAVGPIRVQLRREGLSVVIDIADEGPGMSPEFIRDSLFQPFATTKGGGHGIGAYQARELLREAGGDLLVLSRLNEGTTMRLLLPAVGGGTDPMLPRTQ